MFASDLNPTRYFFASLGRGPTLRLSDWENYCSKPLNWEIFCVIFGPNKKIVSHLIEGKCHHVACVCVD